MPASSGFGFEILAQDPGQRARLGRLTTPHGVIDTPAIMFCATRGTIKAAGPDDLEAAGAQVMLANTYHLMLRPGSDRIQRLGGIHLFTGWRGPIFTDSGGFQVFSLGHGSVTDEIKARQPARPTRKSLLQITEEGVDVQVVCRWPARRPDARACDADPARARSRPRRRARRMHPFPRGARLHGAVDGHDTPLGGPLPRRVHAA